MARLPKFMYERDPDPDKPYDWFCMFGVGLAVFIIMVERFSPGATANTLLEIWKWLEGYLK